MTLSMGTVRWVREVQYTVGTLGTLDITYIEGVTDAWHPSKTKVGSCDNHQTNPETGNK